MEGNPDKSELPPPSGEGSNPSTTWWMEVVEEEQLEAEVQEKDLEEQEGGPKDNRVDLDPNLDVDVELGHGHEHDAAVQEQFLEQLQATKASVAELRRLLDEKDEEIARLQKKYSRAKQMFRNEWRAKKEEWRRMRAELEVLAQEEKHLLETIHGLKSELEQVSSEGGIKLEEIRTLAKKMARLKYDEKVKKGPRILKEDNLEESRGQSQDQDPVTILPEEIWKFLFENHVPRPEDLWSLCHTCHLFDDILSSWKTGWLLSKALPYLYKDLPSAKLLECRTICKSWKWAVDSFLETHSSILPHTPEHINIDPRKLDYVDPMKQMELRNIILTFCNKEDSSILEDPVIPTPSPKMSWTSPFIGRCVILNLDEFKPSQDKEDEDIRRLLEKVCNFLARFGTEIWYMAVWFPQINEEEQMLNPRIVQFLATDLFRLVPNLREIDMGSIKGLIHVDSLPTPESLPVLPKLETLQAYQTRFHDPFIDVLLQRYHVQLRKLCVGAQCGWFSELLQYEFPLLTELHLNCILSPVDLCNLSWVRMPRLSKLGLNLEEAVMNIFNLDTVLAAVRDLCSTTRLNTLRLDGGLQLLQTGDHQHHYHAPPQLKTLEVDHNWEDVMPNYGFLLQYFPFIENVHLFLRRDYDFYETELGLRPHPECVELAQRNGFLHQDKFEIVEVNKFIYDGAMYRSNIWGLMAPLKVFSFQWDVYTRQGYEEYLEKRGKR